MISCSKAKNNLCFAARYRGYYYDNETGYYYLQSRYYDPTLGRFISADDFSYVDTSHKLNVNAYSYCWNSPIALEDAEGTTPQISIDLSALQPLVEGATTVIKAGLNKLAENIKKLMSKYNDFIDKLEFNINHPDVVINNGLSKILGREVSIKFPLINAIRAYFGTFDIRTGELVGGAGDGYHTSDSDNEENAKNKNFRRSSAKNRTKGYVSEVGKAVAAIITEMFVFWDLQKIASELKVEFSFDGYDDYKKKKAQLYKKWFDTFDDWNKPDILWTASTKFAKNISGFISLLSTFVPEAKVKAALIALPYATSALSDFSGRYLSIKGGLIMLAYDWYINATTGITAIGASGGSHMIESILNILFGKFFDKFTAGNVEDYAYNWYL